MPGTLPAWVIEVSKEQRPRRLHRVAAISGAVSIIGNACGSDIDCGDPDERCCRGICMNVTADNANCGDCDSPCDEDFQQCCYGQCRNINGTWGYCGDCTTQCKPEQTCCPTGAQGRLFGCFNLSSNPSKCGTCNKSCNAGEGCCQGVCTALDTDDNCGGCRVRCRPDKTGEHCDPTTLTCTCPSGQVECSGFCCPTGVCDIRPDRPPACCPSPRACRDRNGVSFCCGDGEVCNREATCIPQMQLL